MSLRFNSKGVINTNVENNFNELMGKDVRPTGKWILQKAWRK